VQNNVFLTCPSFEIVRVASPHDAFYLPALNLFVASLFVYGLSSRLLTSKQTRNDKIKAIKYIFKSTFTSTYLYFDVGIEEYTRHLLSTNCLDESALELIHTY